MRLELTKLRFWKLKVVNQTKVNLRNVYMKMVVLGLILLIFWNWFRIWTWKYRFPTFFENLIPSPLTTPCICLHVVKRQKCAASSQIRFWKLKMKSNKLVDLRNVYLIMVVFGLELLIFWSWFRILWTWKYWFLKFLKISFLPPPPPLNHTVHLHVCRGETADHEISSVLASKSY